MTSIGVELRGFLSRHDRTGATAGEAQPRGRVVADPSTVPGFGDGSDVGTAADYKTAFARLGGRRSARRLDAAIMAESPATPAPARGRRPRPGRAA